MSAPKYTLYTMDVSNHGQRCKMLLSYLKVPETEVAVEAPSALGGLKSEEFLTQANRHGKMPALVGEGLAVAESDTIARFLGGTYGASGDFSPQPGSLLALKADVVCRHHDVYLAPLQGALYKESPRGQPFSAFGTRALALDEFEKQLAALEDLVVEEGRYLLGDAPTQADCAVFPTLVFAEFMLPLFEGRSFALGPKLAKWWAYVCAEDEVAVATKKQMLAALEPWQARGRWSGILGAGKRDADTTIFDKILAKQIPSTMVYEDDFCYAFKDIAPVAPVHVLLIPKLKSGLTQLQFATDDNIFLLGHMMSKVGHVAKLSGLDTYRLAVNDGAEVGQSVFHLHLHIIGGRPLSWPPG